MSYNKARAEKEWLRWKNAEEQQLRELGVDEEIIQRLHTYDWEVFKSDRRYYEKLSDTSLYSVTEENLAACIQFKSCLMRLKTSACLQYYRHKMK